MALPKYETRTLDELRQHYDVEKRLAQLLVNAPSTKRRSLYCSVYTELLQSVPLHPHHTRKADPRQSQQEIDDKMLFLTRFLKPETTFLEVGAGNCKLALRVATMVRKVFALEISEEIVKSAPPAKNLEVVISDGCNIPLPDGGVDLVYSYQVMEHIHPDDAQEQLRNIHTCLAPGGKYICITPNRTAGPHDISQYFDEVARGLHLKEYSWGELSALMLRAGFASVVCYAGIRNKYIKLPLRVLTFVEGLIGALPRSIRSFVGNLRLMRNLLFITAVATK